MQASSGIRRAGKLTAIKTGNVFQFLSFLPVDEPPPLGETESAYCYLRAMAHNVTVAEDEELDTWLKKIGKPTRCRPTLDGLNVPKLSTAQTAALFKVVAAKWSDAAQEWWAAEKLTHTELVVHNDFVTTHFLPRPLHSTTESRCCEQGSRQKKSKAGGVTKGEWHSHGCKWALLRAALVSLSSKPVDGKPGTFEVSADSSASKLMAPIS